MTSKAKRSEAPLIFIVDDDLSVRRSTARLVRTSGMRAAIFASAQELLDSGRVVDGACLILDVRMPNMDGLELQRLLSETKQRIPVIFFSARATKEEEDRALRSGAVAFLRKPVGKDALLRVIHRALESAN
jgi:two-component system, LuxR family, response regulator FixJ